MPTKLLRQDTIKPLPYFGTHNAQCIYWDQQLPCFGVRVYPNGRRVFVCSYRVQGRKRLATNKEIIYGLLFDIAAEILRTIAADPKHLGARIGTTLVLHTWGSALTHHPHVHGIVPGGGLALDANRWVPCKPGFFLSVRVLSRLFRRRFLEELAEPASWRATAVLRRSPRSGRPRGLCRLAHAAAPVRVGRLRQAPVRRT